MTAPTLRLFIAIELPAAWREALAGEAGRLEEAAPGFGRWVDAGIMHLTLLFLGSQPEELVLGVASTLDEVASQHRVSSLEPGHLGFFGSPRHVRVMWAGVTDSPPGALADLHRAVGQALGRQHIAFEDTPFHAHVTLGRARRGARPDRSAAMAEAIGASPLWGTGSSTRCEEVVLFESDLRPTGPFYTLLHRARLDAGRAEPDQGTAG